MHTVVYHWKIKSGFEEKFKGYWATATRLFITEQNSLGSRLHLANDGTYYAYAQWPSEEMFNSERKLSAEHAESLRLMIECIETTLPASQGHVICDLLVK
jgi:hypothetical protein